MVRLFESDSERGKPLFWEHEGNSAVRINEWKLVRNYPGAWELYNMDEDRTELRDRAAEFPERVEEMSRQYEAWAERCGVIPREIILQIMNRKGSR
jgi:arylsulfatase